MADRDRPYLLNDGYSAPLFAAEKTGRISERVQRDNPARRVRAKSGWIELFHDRKAYRPKAPELRFAMIAKMLEPGHYGLPVSAPVALIVAEKLMRSSSGATSRKSVRNPENDFVSPFG